MKLAEPILLEDLVHNNDSVEGDFGLVETAVMRNQPGELWLHVRPEWTDEGIYKDVMEAVDFQLRGGRAVVFQNDDCDGRLWESTIEGWEKTGYTVDHDFEIDGTEYVRVIYEADIGYAKVKEVLANEDGPPDRLQPEAEDGRPPDRADGAERLERPAAPLERGARATRFPPSVPGHIASSLRRLHQNLDHPGVSDFVRRLRLAGASRAVLKAAKMLECQVCARGKAPAIAKPEKIGSCLRFNEIVGVDLMYCHDSEGVKHQLLSMVDFSSSYHVVVAVPRKDTYHLERAFCEHWLNVFGAPKVLAIDMETGLEKSLSRVGDYTGTKLRHAAGQAHWQAGCTERQGALWKTIFAKINDEMAITKGDLRLAIGAVSSAKNNLIKTSGYSPVQHVFGSTANMRAFDLGDEPVIDDSQAREVAIRTSARMAFHQVQTDERVRRALLGRTRVSQRRPEVGEQVFYWRKPATSKSGRWLGPATVIGYEDNNVWVTKSGRCVLCAPEHLRLATGEELGEAFSLRAAREDLERLLQADDEADEAFNEDDLDIEGYEEADDEEMAELDGEGEERLHRGGQRRPQEAAPPQVLKRHRAKGPEGQKEGRPHAKPVCMLKPAKTARSREKQLEKEIPWSQIPPEVRPLFRRQKASNGASALPPGLWNSWASKPLKKSAVQYRRKEY